MLNPPKGPKHPASMMRVVVDNFEELISVGLLLIIGISMFLQVLLRTFFNFPQSWPEELSQFLFVWAAAFGAIGASKRTGGLVRIESLIDRVPAAAQRALSYIGLVAIITLLGIVGWQGWQLALRTSFAAATLPITWAWAYAAAPVFSILMIIRLLQGQIFSYRFVHIETLLAHKDKIVAPTGNV